MIFTNIYICTILLFLKMSQIASCRCQPCCRCVTDRLVRMDVIQRRNEGRGRLKRFTTSETNAKIFKISLCYSRSLRKLFFGVTQTFYVISGKYCKSKYLELGVRHVKVLGAVDPLLLENLPGFQILV